MPWALAPALSVFAVVGVVLAVTDVRTHRLPDAVLLPGAVAVLLLLAVAAIALGDGTRAAGVAAGTVAAFLACLAVHLARPASFGGGDVKLAALCGAVLGWHGLAFAASGIALGLVGAGIAASGTLLAGARHAPIALGPFLLIGTAWRLLTAPD